MVGLETVQQVADPFGEVLRRADLLVLAIFALEIVLKIAAEGRRPWRYFADPWNVLDFTVTAVCLLPLHAQCAQVLRLGRVARSRRMVTALMLFTLLHSDSGMGVFPLGANDPVRFGSLWASLLTMSGVLTLEGWVDTMREQRMGLSHDDGSPGPGSPMARPIT